jgi:hypothetical protein
MSSCQPSFSSYHSLVLSQHLHVVHQRHLALLIANDRELELAAADLIDVLDPPAMALNCVRAQANELDTALCELRLKFCECAELGGADGGVVFGVGEEDDPAVADEVVEVNLNNNTRNQSVNVESVGGCRIARLTGPVVVSASKFGATEPRRRGAEDIVLV